MDGTSRAGLRQALVPLLDDPRRAALLLDVDGTLAPIVPRAEEAAVPARTRDLLAALGDRYGLVACVSGRRATDARRVVGVDSLTYVGNHGLERLRPGQAEVEDPPGLTEHSDAVAELARSAYTGALRDLGVRLEDKRSIWSFHWRGAPDEEAARRALEPVAEEGARSGLSPHWGRKVLELRPPVAVDKGVAVAALVRDSGARAALYAGDDTTDLHAFRGLRELRASGELTDALCVGVHSDEAPAGLAREADLLVEGTEGVAELLEQLAHTNRETT